LVDVVEMWRWKERKWRRKERRKKEENSDLLDSGCPFPIEASLSNRLSMDKPCLLFFLLLCARLLSSSQRDRVSYWRWTKREGRKKPETQINVVLGKRDPLGVYLRG